MKKPKDKSFEELCEVYGEISNRMDKDPDMVGLRMRGAMEIMGGGICPCQEDAVGKYMAGESKKYVERKYGSQK